MDPPTQSTPMSIDTQHFLARQILDQNENALHAPSVMVPRWGLVPHRVVSHVVLASSVAPYLIFTGWMETAVHEAATRDTEPLPCTLIAPHEPRWLWDCVVSIAVTAGDRACAAALAAWPLDAVGHVRTLKYAWHSLSAVGCFHNNVDNPPLSVLEASALTSKFASVVRLEGSFLNVASSLSHFHEQVREMVVSDSEGFSNVALFPQTTDLSLRGLRFDSGYRGSAAFSSVASLPKLKRLFFDSTMCKDGWLQTVAQLSCLEEMTCCAMDAPFGDMEQLAQLTSLHTLNFTGCNLFLRAEHVPAIGQCRQLRRLSMNNCDSAVTSDSLWPLRHLRLLEDLGLAWNDAAFGPTLMRLLDEWPALVYLDLRACGGLTAAERSQQFLEGDDAAGDW